MHVIDAVLWADAATKYVQLITNHSGGVSVALRWQCPMCEHALPTVRNCLEASKNANTAQTRGNTPAPKSFVTGVAMGCFFRFRPERGRFFFFLKAPTGPSGLRRLEATGRAELGRLADAPLFFFRFFRLPASSSSIPQ